MPVKNKGAIKRLINSAPYGTVQIIIDDFDFKTEKKLIELLDKKMQFVESPEHGWIRKFTRVVLAEDGVYIGHHFNKTKSMIKMTRISNPLKTIKEWIKYFDTI